MTVWTPVGNVGKFNLTPKPEFKDHYSSMQGTKVLDKIATIFKDAEFSMEVDEFTPDNAVMALLGLVGTDTAAEPQVQIMGVSSVERQLRFVGTNDFGAHLELILPHVFLFCKDAINLIFDDWGTLPITGRVLNNNGSFGVVNFLAGATGSAPLVAPNTLNYYIGKGVLSTAVLGT